MKSIVIAAAISLMSISAMATESYSSADQLPEGSVIEAMYSLSSGRPVCPKKHNVAKKYCWNKRTWRFKHCGYFCSPIPPPPRGGQH
ncbi:hypothetical protein [Bdellovibrio sp. HCB2-146]|uniref:hypothetical protein n=1 Tax=Bdellovibrio sp. HCB2-146 TaxID=3394362 RepID=UPI0039BD77AA